MENEDYRIVNLHNNMLKVYRDGRVEKEFIYKYGSKDGKYKKGDKKLVEVGGLHKSTGYYRFELNTKKYYIHRVMGYAYLGLDIDDKTEVIDHIDNNRINNNLINLRVTTMKGNAFNRSNTKGYTFRKYRNKYEVNICINGKTIFLGHFKTEICARYAYLTAKNHYHKY